MIARVGLRWRLVAWVTLAMVGVCAVVFVVVYRQTGSGLRSQIVQDTHGDLAELAQAVRTLRPGSTAQLARGLRRYIDAQPYSDASTLLFAVIPGRGTISNHRELFGSARPDGGESISEQRRENREGHALLVGPLGSRTAQAPDVGAIALDERQVASAGARIRLGAGAALLPVVRAQRSVARSFLLAGLLALALTAAASYLAGGVVTRPIRRLATIAGRISDGALRPRTRVSPHAAHEIRTLADSFNRMLDRLAAAFERERAFLADASHELRTPLTVIAGQLEVLAGDPAPSRAETRRTQQLTAAEIARMSRLVDDMLLLTRADSDGFLRRARIELPAYLGDLWEATTGPHRRRFTLAPVPAVALHADPDRLAQALRNLIENAIAHTEPPDGAVSLTTVLLDGGRVRFSVRDDGPGIPADRRRLVFDRFYRSDLARDRASGGAGLGLAIVRAVASAHGGGAWVAEADAGAQLELELPGGVAAETPRRPATAGERTSDR